MPYLDYKTNVIIRWGGGGGGLWWWWWGKKDFIFTQHTPNPKKETFLCMYACAVGLSYVLIKYYVGPQVIEAKQDNEELPMHVICWHPINEELVEPLKVKSTDGESPLATSTQRKSNWEQVGPFLRSRYAVSPKIYVGMPAVISRNSSR